MAVGTIGRTHICRLARLGLTSTHGDRLAGFYESAFGFRRLADEQLSTASFATLMGVEGGAQRITLGLGQEIVELLQFHSPGRPYPRESTSADIVFQHFAIVVANIDAAYQRLSTVGGWTAISTGGPQRLPATSGGVSAFKFRDPDGHPLELLAFAQANVPPRWRGDAGGELFLGIDHSAISVRDSTRSISFYEGLGFKVAARSLNTGPEQERLDGIHDPRVEVTALASREVTAHVELLCYRSFMHGAGVILRNNDIAATRLVLETCNVPGTATESVVGRCVLDPDGHHLLIV